MAYLGRVRPTETTSSISRSTYTGDGSTTTFTLPTPVANETSIIATINGVMQQDAAYTTNGTQIIFASAPTLNDAIEIRTVSDVGFSYAPSPGSVTTGTIADTAVTTAKLDTTLDLSSKTVTYGLSGSDMPSGSVLQVATDTLEGVISGSYAAGVPSTITNGVEVFSVSFTPTSASSTILVMTSSVAISEDANVANVMWLALWDGSTFVCANSGTWGYNNFANYRNAAYHSLCHTYDAGSTSTRTISVRAGINGGSTVHQYINGQSYSYNYTGSSARIQMTVMEIAG